MQVTEQPITRTALSHDDAARYLGIKPAGLRWLVFQSKGPAYMRIGRRIYFRIRDLEKFQEAHLINPVEE